VPKSKPPQPQQLIWVDREASPQQQKAQFARQLGQKIKPHLPSLRRKIQVSLPKP
jgi:hypothetical protein